jgi:hypothetical protein
MIINHQTREPLAQQLRLLFNTSHVTELLIFLGGGPPTNILATINNAMLFQPQLA